MVATWHIVTYTIFIWSITLDFSFIIHSFIYCYDVLDDVTNIELKMSVISGPLV